MYEACEIHNKSSTAGSRVAAFVRIVHYLGMHISYRSDVYLSIL